MTLEDGSTIRGPQPVRDEKHVMGFPWLSAQTKIELRQSNSMALRGVRRAKSQFGASRFVTIERPYNSWLWYFNLVKELQQAGFTFASGSNCCFGGDREKWYALLNNSPAIQAELRRPKPSTSKSGAKLTHEGLNMSSITMAGSSKAYEKAVDSASNESWSNQRSGSRPQKWPKRSVRLSSSSSSA